MKTIRIIRSGGNSPASACKLPPLSFLQVLPRTVPWCWCVGISEGRRHRCPSDFSHGPQLRCSLILWHLRPKIKKHNNNKRTATKDLMCFLFAFMTWYSCVAPELSAILPALIQIFQTKCNLYARWENSSEPKYIQRTQRGITEKKRFTVCKNKYSVNITPVYLFSNHLGLLVNLLPIGHITQEVMALRSWESDLFSCFFEALLRSAPQDHLARSNVFRGRKTNGEMLCIEPVLKSEATQVNRCLLRNKTGRFNGQSSTKTLRMFCAISLAMRPGVTVEIFEQRCSFHSENREAIFTATNSFRARLKARGLLCEWTVSSSTRSLNEGRSFEQGTWGWMEVGD